MNRGTVIDTQTKVGWGVLVVLIGAVISVANVTFTANATARSVADLQSKQERVEQIAVDVAVVKEQVFEINRKMDRRGPKKSLDGDGG